MQKYIIVCGECGAHNEIENDKCENCGEVFTTDRKIEVINYRTCLACGAKNYVLEGKDPKVCWRCKSDEIQKSPREAVGSRSAIELEVPVDSKESVETKKPVDQQSYIAPASRKVEISKTILVMESHTDSYRIEITGEDTVIGRMGMVESEYFSKFGRIGRFHARILNKNGLWRVVDSSRNGTWINGVLLEKNKDSEANILNDGDLLTLADQHYKVRICLRSNDVC